MSLEVVGGFEVEICASGAEALERATSFAPQLILLDVMMPDMDGPQVLAALRRTPVTAATPVIFMTAKIQSHDISHYKQLGVLDVIRKPFDPMRLPEDIRTMWAACYE